MKTLKEITAAREAFRAASVAYEEDQKVVAELQLDVAIAERGKDEDAIMLAKAALAENRKSWHLLFNARKDAALALLDAIDVKLADIKYII